MLIQQIGIVSETANLTVSELTRVSAALQKQALRDLGPIWDISATVDPFASLDDLPIGYWPLVIQDNIGFDAAGIHLDQDGQPFSLVNFDSQWSLTASHEVLEMLVDPFGSRLIAGKSLKAGQGRVEYLVEVCDPSEAPKFGYTVNGVLVSDFYTQHFFDPVRNTGTRYSFTGAIRSPREVLQGGYISWHDPVSDHWFQLLRFSGPARIVDLGKLTVSGASIRAVIDPLTSEKREKILKEGTKTAVKGVARPATKEGRALLSSSRSVVFQKATDSTTSRAASLRAQISQILGRG